MRCEIGYRKLNENLYMEQEEREHSEGEKLIQMLISDDMELRQLGLNICRAQFPAIWAALLNYTGRGAAPDRELIYTLSQFQHFNVGTNVRYRGLDGAPQMIVTSADVEETNSNVTGMKGWNTFIKCIWYNKSSQKFEETRNRVECFEIIPPKIKTETTQSKENEPRKEPAGHDRVQDADGQ
jgi:uncharacterized protein YodC (DUF2158 family)